MSPVILDEQEQLEKLKIMKHDLMVSMEIGCLPANIDISGEIVAIDRFRNASTLHLCVRRKCV